MYRGVLLAALFCFAFVLPASTLTCHHDSWDTLLRKSLKLCLLKLRLDNDDAKEIYKTNETFKEYNGTKTLSFSYSLYFACMKPMWRSCLIFHPTTNIINRVNVFHQPCARLQFQSASPNHQYFHIKLFGQFQINLTFVSFDYPISISGCVKCHIKVGTSSCTILYYFGFKQVMKC